jgi:hypothetical protein
MVWATGVGFFATYFTFIGSLPVGFQLLGG